MNVRADFSLIERMASSLRDMLGEDYDDATFMDTLDGETDAGDLADRLLEAVQDAEAMADAIRGQEADMKARRARFEARGDAYRKQLLTLLDAVGVKKMERPRATVSRRAGIASVQITDEASIPTQLCKVVSTPDKAAIKAQLMAGEIVPGAQLSIGDDGVTVRAR